MRSFPRGTRIGPYAVEREIARGGMGTVLEARRAIDGAVVALKVLSIEGANPAQLARFEREAELAARLSHPGIVKVHERGQEGALPWIAMDRVDGRPLSDLIGRLPVREAARLVAQVARAIEHAHAHGVIHRDLKPSNVLVCADGRALVTDFGVALDPTADSLTRTGALVGTPQYMSPEQAAGREVGPKSDVHALGALLHAALVGSPPFRSAHLVELLTAITVARPVRPGSQVSGVPAALDRLVLAALAKAPADRPSAGDFAAELEAIAEGRAGSGPIPAAAVGALALALGAVVGWLLLPASRDPEAPPPPPAPVASASPPPASPGPWVEPPWMRELADRKPGALEAAFDGLLGARAPLDPRSAARAAQVLAGLDRSWVEPDPSDALQRIAQATELLLIHAVWRLVDPTHEPDADRTRRLGDAMVVEIGTALLDVSPAVRRASIRLARALVVVFPHGINGYLFYAQCASTYDPGRDESVVRRGIELALELENHAAWGELIDNHGRWLSHRAVLDVPPSPAAREELMALARAVRPLGERAPRSAANVLLYTLDVVPAVEARVNIARAEALIGRIGDVEHGWSVVHQAEGDLEAALRCSRRAVALAPPGGGGAHWAARLANLEVEAGQTETACQVLESAMGRDPVDVALPINLALILAGQGGPPERLLAALEELERRAGHAEEHAALLRQDAVEGRAEAAAGDLAALRRRLEPWLPRLAGIGRAAPDAGR